MRVLSSRMRGRSASRSALVLRLAAMLGGSALAACTPDTTEPIGQGNNVITDVDGSGPVEQQGGDDADTSDSASSANGDYGIDGSAPMMLCAQCGCEGGTFCFAGSASSPASTCGGASGLGGSAPMIGCNAIPAGCDGGDDCPCLLQSIAPELSCYPVCQGPSGAKTLFCPH